MTDNVVQLPFGKPKGSVDTPLIPVMTFTAKDGSVHTLEITESDYEWYGLILIKLSKFPNAVRWFVISNPEALKLDVRRAVEMVIPRIHFEAFTASFNFTCVFSPQSLLAEDDFLRLSEMDHCTLMDELRLEKLTLPFALYLLPTTTPDSFKLIFAEL